MTRLVETMRFKRMHITRYLHDFDILVQLDVPVVWPRGMR